MDQWKGGWESPLEWGGVKRCDENLLENLVETGNQKNGEMEVSESEMLDFSYTWSAK